MQSSIPPSLMVDDATKQNASAASYYKPALSLLLVGYFCHNIIHFVLLFILFSIINIFWGGNWSLGREISGLPPSLNETLPVAVCISMYYSIVYYSIFTPLYFSQPSLNFHSSVQLPCAEFKIAVFFFTTSVILNLLLLQYSYLKSIWVQLTLKKSS